MSTSDNCNIDTRKLASCEHYKNDQDDQLAQALLKAVEEESENVVSAVNVQTGTDKAQLDGLLSPMCLTGP
ncbi:hypothetical protein H2200_013090 [Cladophialophora chaetospira]|uniref:Uncharacterized protein n=1 Tax=Cladophialophora chaetospira TaxID=386627 RepID=A0AA38WWS4_9EURO|nr:hypothetical protein H2200_013090 [Cladophialophora chaetospira]